MLEIHKRKNYLYTLRFKRTLIAELKEKQKLFPEKVSKTEIKKITTLKDFDDFYTSKAHSFINALDYYDKNSSLQFLKNIEVPALTLNAKNDSFLSERCFPAEEVRKNNNLYLEIPVYGGHVGFYNVRNVYYNEK